MKTILLLILLAPTLAFAQSDPVVACSSLEPSLKNYCIAIQLQNKRPCERISTVELRNQCFQTVKEQDWYCSRVEDSELYDQCRKAALLGL